MKSNLIKQKQAMKGKLTIVCIPFQGAREMEIVIHNIEESDVKSVLADQYKVKSHKFKAH